MAIVCYCFFKYLLPEMVGDAQMRQKLGETGDLAAPLSAIAFLFLAANALFHGVPTDEEAQGDGNEKKEEDKEQR
ncbi:MAG: hypothetical protein ABR512_09430 [Desulfopila sp.]